MRIDICKDNLKGVYVQGKWMAVRSLEVNVFYPEPEKVFVLGSAAPVWVDDLAPVYSIRMELDDGSDTTLSFDGPGLQVTYWDTNEQYQFKTNTYVIDEIAL